MGLFGDKGERLARIEQAVKDLAREGQRDRETASARRAERDKVLKHIDDCVDETKSAVTNGQHALELRVQALENALKMARWIVGIMAGALAALGVDWLNINVLAR